MLSLNKNQIDEEVAMKVGEFIASYKNLECVNLGSCQITDQVVEILSSFIIKNTKLSVLWLDGNHGITDKSLPCIIKMIEATNLQTIKVHMTSLSELRALVLPIGINLIKNKTRIFDLREM